jgi:hypothetical protein
MNMSHDLGGMDFIVLTVLLFVVVFVAAWLSSPALRTWIERPKYRFLADVTNHDRAQKDGPSK